MIKFCNLIVRVGENIDNWWSYPVRVMVVNNKIVQQTTGALFNMDGSLVNTHPFHETECYLEVDKMI